MIDQNRDGLIDVKDLQAIYAQIGMMQFFNEYDSALVRKRKRLYDILSSSVMLFLYSGTI